MHHKLCWLTPDFFSQELKMLQKDTKGTSVQLHDPPAAVASMSRVSNERSNQFEGESV